jgi:UDP-3-O-acyl-N-acetylglucosamine deacetylase
MRQRGLARGGSLDNTIVVGKRTVLNESLRFPTSSCGTRSWTCVGDLFLLGRPILGHVVARNAGHAMNHQLAAAIRKAALPERRRYRSAPVEALVAEAAYRSAPGVAAL